MTTASEILERRFRESRDHVLLDTAGGRRFTYGAYYANARRIAALWSSQGLEPGDCVALHLPNGPAYPCLYLACAIGGFVACPISPDLLPAAVDDILALARPALVIRETPALDPGLAAPADGDIRFEGANAETFGIFFSSGTTGRPKGICHRLESFLGSALSFGRLAGFSAKTRLYHVLPMAYMAGFHNTMLTPLLAGATLVEGPQFSSRTALDFWSDPVARKANTLSLVPSIAAALCRLARDPGQARAAASGLRQVQSTAAPLNAALRGSFLETFGLPLQDCYGVTELGGPLTFQSHEAALAERPWVQPLPELACRLKNDASGEPELWVRSPFLMQGYLTETGFQAPELEDGYFASGDIAELRSTELRLIGRSRDIIIRGGVNIAPIALENAISLVQGVEDVAVVAGQHDVWGEIAVACVLPGEATDREALARSIKAQCARTLSKPEQPDRILFLEDFPRTLAGKVKKKDLGLQVGRILDGAA